MSKRNLMVAVLVAPLFACQTTSGMIDTIPSQGTVVTGSYEAANGRVKIPLPPGNWVVAGANITRVGYQNPIEEAVLVKVGEDDGLTMIDIRTAIAISRTGWQPGRLCERDDIDYLDRVSNPEGSLQECWGVRNFSTDLQKDLPAYLVQTEQYAKANGIELGYTAKAVSYRFADKSYFVDASYLFKPDDVTVDGLKEWGISWRPKVERGFYGEQ